MFFLILYHARPSSLVPFAKAFSLTSFEVKIRFLGFLIFSKREKERDFLNLPLVADVEHSIGGDLLPAN